MAFCDSPLEHDISVMQFLVNTQLSEERVLTAAAKVEQLDDMIVQVHCLDGPGRCIT